ncbi:MAG: sugar transferase [Saprospiraceae bacterium]|nr:sugar transferase [Saprospiraceae bacterium]
MYPHLIKPFWDFLLSLMALVLFFPILLLLTIILFSSNNGQPFFTQIRPGKNGRPFTLLKFKTMNDVRDEKGRLLPDAVRLTRVGRIVRKTSLDELPQLINVLRGDMSLVGPRPLLPEYLPLYSTEQSRRHNVRPGITGWAQVNGRNAISWVQKFAYDVWYVDHQSFWLDLKILFHTIIKVFKASDINSDKVTTMEKFTGSHE